MDKIDELRRELHDRNLSEVSRQTGIGWQTLHEIRNGKRQDMHLSTWQVLVKYLRRGDAQNSGAL